MTDGQKVRLRCAGHRRFEPRPSHARGVKAYFEGNDEHRREMGKSREDAAVACTIGTVHQGGNQLRILCRREDTKTSRKITKTPCQLGGGQKTVQLES